MNPTNMWSWDQADFLTIGVLSFISVLLGYLVMTKIKSNTRRLLVIGIIILGFIYIWAELAVGIFTNLGS